MASNTDAEAQVQNFLHFFRLKRGVAVKEIEYVIQDVVNDRLLEDMYSREDVEEIVEKIIAQASDRVDKDFEQQTNMSALVIEQLFASARANNVPLEIDLSKTEDEALLAEVGKLNITRMAEQRLRQQGARKLETFKDDNQRLMTENTKLRENVAALENELNTTKEKASKCQSEKEQAESKVDELKADLQRQKEQASASTSEASSTSATLEADNKKLRGRVAELQTQLEDVQSKLESYSKELADQETAISQTKQFQQLKAMIQRKNSQLVELRTRLSKYEPDDTAGTEEIDTAAAIKSNKK